ncbi:hypothetical protein NC651_032452 [Populus alba x Populus x berolinensis]|nr:hypothetical protein NC651_032452 [Populus alba x Populus x berolinensis]
MVTVMGGADTGIDKGMVAATMDHLQKTIAANAPPATSLPSAIAALPADDDSNHGHGHRHRNRHGHRHGNGHRLGGRRHGHSHGGLEENCCRWLSDVDPECVCELLVRLPPFLSKQHHEYTVKIDDTCSVSYSC